MKAKAIFPFALAGLLALAGCGGLSGPGDGDGGGDLSELEQAANEEGALTIYSSASEDVLRAVVDAFNEEYPQIRVSTFRAAGSELLNRYASEAEAGAVAADILAPSVNPEFLEDNTEWFIELSADEIPNLADWPDQFVYPRHVGVAVTTTVITYNTELLAEADVPTTWQDLLDPKYAGNAMLLDPRASDGYLSLFWILRDRFGDDYLRGLAAQNFTLTDSGATAAQEVAAGSYAMAIGNYAAHSRDLINQGAPVKLVTNLDPTPGLIHAAGISVDAPHPNAARLFMNWYLTRPAQEAACAGVYAPVKEPLASCPELPSNYTEAVWGIPANEKAQILSLLNLN